MGALTRASTGGGVERLLWAVGEARRLRLQGPAAATTPADRISVDVRSVSAHSGRGQVTVVGRLDAANGRAFLRIVQALVADGTTSVVVDLRRAEVLNAGVDVLATALRHLEQRDGAVLLKAPPATTVRLLRHAGLIGRFPVC